MSWTREDKWQKYRSYAQITEMGYSGGFVGRIATGASVDVAAALLYSRVF